MWKKQRSLAVGAAMFAAGLLGLVSERAMADPPLRSLLFYVGTYTRGASQGVYRMRLDLVTGKLTQVGEPTAAVNPSFVALHPNGKYLYAVSEIADFQGAKSGAIAAYRIGEEGELTELNRRASGGGGPCHVIVDAAGKHVLAANYGGGSVAVLPIADDGSLRDASCIRRHAGSSVHPRRQQGPHAHSINLDRENRFAFAADLGLDQVIIYAFDAAKGQLDRPQPVKLAPGAGPRHLALHPTQPWAYVINELNSTITRLEIRDEGAATVAESVSTLPKDFAGTSFTAEVVVHPRGKFVYGSNRGHDSIAAFSVGESGKLTPVGIYSTRGETPRNFRIDPSGRYLLAANQATDTIEVFRISEQSGELKHVGGQRVPTPVCIRFAR